MLNELGLKMWLRDMARLVMAHRIGIQGRVDPSLKVRLQRVFDDEMSQGQRDEMSLDASALVDMTTEDLASAGTDV